MQVASCYCECRQNFLLTDMHGVFKKVENNLLLACAPQVADDKHFAETDDDRES